MSLLKKKEVVSEPIDYREINIPLQINPLEEAYLVVCYYKLKDIKLGDYPVAVSSLIFMLIEQMENKDFELFYECHKNFGDIHIDKDEYLKWGVES